MPKVFDVLNIALDPPAGESADFVAATPDLVVWMDGAAPFGDRRAFDAPNDAVWFVRAFTEALLSLDREGRSTTDLLRHAQRVTSNLYEAAIARASHAPAERPFACIGIARIVDDVLELVNIGDCTTFIASPGASRARRFGYCSVADLDDAALDALNVARAREGLSHAAAFSSIESTIVENRGRRNLQFGYDVVEPSLSGFVEHERILAPAKAGTLVLGMTDGFARACDVYGLMSEDDLFAQAAGGGLDGIVSRIREAELGDPEVVAYPRLKPMDDVAAILVRIDTVP